MSTQTEMKHQHEDDEETTKSSWTDCFKSRTKRQWGQLIGGYTLLYTFFGCWMAMHMAIYISITPDECTFRNGGNICIGEPKFSGLRKTSIVAVDRFPSLECSSNSCNGTMEIRINRDYRLRELDGLIEVTCKLMSSAHDVNTLDYKLSNCVIPENDIVTVIEEASTPGVLDNRDCLTTESVVMQYQAGALLPFAHQFTLEVPELSPFDFEVECLVSANNNTQTVKRDSVTIELSRK